jgi:hypothetical protein
MGRGDLTNAEWDRLKSWSGRQTRTRTAEAVNRPDEGDESPLGAAPFR